MGQETHYYNNVIAQLIAIRDETSKNEQFAAKLDEVISAIKDIKITTEAISVEAGTINLNTDELEKLIKDLNDNIIVINNNIEEFNTNVQDKFNEQNTLIQTCTNQIVEAINNLGNSGLVFATNIE